MPPDDELAPDVDAEAVVAEVDDVDEVVVVAPPAPVVPVLEVSTPPQPARSDRASALKRRERVMLARIRRTRGVGARLTETREEKITKPCFAPTVWPSSSRR